MGMFPGSREVRGVLLAAWCRPPRAWAVESRHGQTAWGRRAAQEWVCASQVGPRPGQYWARRFLPTALIEALPAALEDETESMSKEQSRGLLALPDSLATHPGSYRLNH